MRILNQAEHLAMFEQQQREFAQRATSTEASEFHKELAKHYARLVDEMRALIPR